MDCMYTVSAHEEQARSVRSRKHLTRHFRKFDMGRSAYRSDYFTKGFSRFGNANLNCSVINEKTRPRPVSSSKKISSLPETKHPVRNAGAASYQRVRLMRLPRDARVIVVGSKTKTSKKTFNSTR